MFFRRKAAHSAILPSLLLASRIVLSEIQTIHLLIARKCHEGFVEHELLLPWNRIFCLKNSKHFSEIDLDTDVSGRGEDYAMTRLRPNKERDSILVFHW